MLNTCLKILRFWMDDIMYKRFVFLCFFLACMAQAQAADQAGRVTFSSGEAWLVRGQSTRIISTDTKVFSGDEVVTQPSGRVKLVMQDGSIVYIGGQSRISVPDYSMKGKGLLRGFFELMWGKARFLVKKLLREKAEFSVKTKTVTLGVRGTQFSISYPAPDIPENVDAASLKTVNIPDMPTTVMLFEGAVVAQTTEGIEHAIKPGNLARIQASGRVFIRPIRKTDIENLKIAPIVPEEARETEDRKPGVKIPGMDEPKDRKPEVKGSGIRETETNITGLDKLEIRGARVKSSKVGKPHVEAPKVGKPHVEAPKVGKPHVEAPKVGKPHVEAPQVEMPEIEEPELD